MTNDYISRQAAIEAVSQACEELRGVFVRCEEKLLALPSAQPERKKGKWVGTEFDGYADGNPVYYEWKCSNCGCIFEDEEPMYNYCPNCGANMKGEQDD